MSLHESSGAINPDDERLHDNTVRYLTDGRNLFEIASYAKNHGLAGGGFTLLRNCVSNTTYDASHKPYEVDGFGLLLLEDVTPDRPAA
jgi:hypothetical protein